MEALQPCFAMNETGLKKPLCPYRAIAVACVMLLLCVCVVTQMLGTPFTLLGLLNSDALTESELNSEDFSALSPSPQPERPFLSHVLMEFHPIRHLPVIVTSVFRPPSA